MGRVSLLKEFVLFRAAGAIDVSLLDGAKRAEPFRTSDGKAANIADRFALRAQCG